MTLSPTKLSIWQMGWQSRLVRVDGRAPPWSTRGDSFQEAGTFKPRDYQYLIIIIPCAGLISTQLSHLNNRRVLGVSAVDLASKSRRRESPLFVPNSGPCCEPQPPPPPPPPPPSLLLHKNNGPGHDLQHPRRAGRAVSYTLPGRMLQLSGGQNLYK